MHEVSAPANVIIFRATIFGPASQDARRMITNMISCSAVIPTCEKVGQWEKALMLLRKMRETGMTVDVVSFMATISACEKKNQ